MKGLMISAFVAVALLAAATTMFWSHRTSAEPPVGSAGTTSQQQANASPDVNKLPIEDFEDQSLVYSKPQ